MDTNLAVDFILKFQKEVITNQWIDGNVEPPLNKSVLVEIKKQDREKSPAFYNVAHFEREYARGWVVANRNRGLLQDGYYVSRWMRIPE